VSSDSAAWLAGPRRLRSIGAVYDPDDDAPFGYTSYLSSEFDLLVSFAASSPTSILPFHPPTSF
jgi:hypothetical protein